MTTCQFCGHRIPAVMSGLHVCADMPNDIKSKRLAQKFIVDIAPPLLSTLRGKTHTLRESGAAFKPDGTTRVEAGTTIAGTGYGSCSCGMTSRESLPTGAARKTWHDQHKKEIA